MEFCQKFSVWPVDDWKCILWTDESPFELFHSSNHQNDRVWCHNSSDVLPQETVKFPQKIMVWDMKSHQALSELPFVPPKRTVNASYYVSEILTKTCKDALNRKQNRDNTRKENNSRPVEGHIDARWCSSPQSQYYSRLV
ncbi:hypothetical protein LOD99_8180 [Oopsacas minuta]|uniref:Uncharacterized protein n=1 Tax=Oopsacas minuta TaxID=111878 RepID=A0AAV7JHP6_9METZ|nr:hypothetical protein LOD99_8180 [Oopsacas minuta]